MLPTTPAVRYCDTSLRHTDAGPTMLGVGSGLMVTDSVYVLVQPKDDVKASVMVPVV